MATSSPSAFKNGFGHGGPLWAAYPCLVRGGLCKEDDALSFAKNRIRACWGVFAFLLQIRIIIINIIDIALGDRMEGS